ncbi:hypothetical protein [Bradyrhizobium sp. SYSU BS000235]|uniref:hypothetical protein n=1 Tax=Bradyrhizobium sp. SYSU BS000235 TaxID=3411332 RepID=UPI003C7687D8
MNNAWAWLTIAGLGAFHGLNPAMGWLFAVALGLHRKNRTIILEALPSIALGHALSVAIIVSAVVLVGFFINERAVLIASGLLLIGWAIYHQIYGHRHRVRFGMKTGLAGLTVWSFLMATAHGAGLMLLPVLIPLCLASSAMKNITPENSFATMLTAVGVHTTAMLVVTGAIAILVYEWIGVAILRSAWINLDLIWVLALSVTGAILLISAY